MISFRLQTGHEGVDRKQMRVSWPSAIRQLRLRPEIPTEGTQMEISCSVQRSSAGTGDEVPELSGKSK